MTLFPRSTATLERMRHDVQAPLCCGEFTRLTDGREVYRHRPDLHAKPIWKCDSCGAYVGCHPGSTRPLGTPAGAELRRARAFVHCRLDPLWQTADRCGAYRPESEAAREKIRRAARPRVYAYLAAQLGIEIQQCHTGMFDIETCRRAYLALAGVNYIGIRKWHHDHKAAKSP